MFNKEKTEERTGKADIKIIRAKQTKKDTVVVFDMSVNGVSIYGCFLREVTVKADGKRYKAGDTAYIISWPSYKGTDEKYYNHCWYPLSKEDEQYIIESVAKAI